MREILFRGKRIFDGKWVNGFAYKQYSAAKVEEWYIRAFETDYLVIPETVCQFTGLYDKNGRKIFEGDIVKWTGSLYKVVFEQRFGTAYFGIKISDYETWYFCNSCAANLMEIAGNVYDNPELLKGGNDNG